MSDLIPRGVEAKPFPTLYPPVDGAGTEPPAAGPGYDPAAAEAVVRSYRHRLGRPPSLDELRAALGPNGFDMNGAVSPGNVYGPVVPTGNASGMAPLAGPGASIAAPLALAVRSFHNRLGRPPTERELIEAIPHDLPAAMPGAVGGFPTTPSPLGVQPLAGPFTDLGVLPIHVASALGSAPQPYGQTDSGFAGEPGSAYEPGDAARSQIAYAENLQSSAVVDPGSTKELNINFGRGQYRAWVRVTNLGSWSSRISPPETRSPLMGGPKYQVNVRFTGDIGSADRMHGRQISLEISNNLPAGQYVAKNLDDAGPIQGPGSVWLHATNSGPHPVEVVLGAYK